MRCWDVRCRRLLRNAERLGSICLIGLTLILLRNGLLSSTPPPTAVALAPLRSRPQRLASTTTIPTTSVGHAATTAQASGVVNPHPFHFTLVEPDVCIVRRPDVYILAIVHTAPGNFKRRMQIRETYGSQRLYPHTRLVTLFAMGLPLDHRLQQAIQLESSEYRDIIQEDFVDSYKNLTYKGIMWLGFVHRYCGAASWVLKVDDDIFVNIFNLAAHLRSLERHGEVGPRSVLCLLWTRMPVLRDASSKWYVSRGEYSGDFYSAYCSGSAFLLRRDVVAPMHDAAARTPFFWVDDFYLTGLLAAKAKAEYKNMASLYVLKREELGAKIVDGFAIFAHVPGNSLSQRYRLWAKVATQRGLGPDPREQEFRRAPKPAVIFPSLQTAQMDRI